MRNLFIYLFKIKRTLAPLMPVKVHNYTQIYPVRKSTKDKKQKVNKTQKNTQSNTVQTEKYKS